jgi:riboflavin biosynthesis pyrimidine reductase
MMVIRQIEPEERRVPLEGMYLSHGLQELAKSLDRPIVVANYVTDLNDVIAIEGVRGSPEELKNPADWRLFQELTAQADVLITGASYMNDFVEKGESVQNVLTQFDKESPFEDLGIWRETHGLKRNPDLVIVSRSLSFSLPEAIFQSGRRALIFTTSRMRESENAKELEIAGATVIAAGYEGVDGAAMIERLDQEGYKVIKMITGPRVLRILMDAQFTSQDGERLRKGALDRLYITRVDRKITDDWSSAITVLEGRRVDDLATEGGAFKLIQRYTHHLVPGIETSQEFLVYERCDLTTGSMNSGPPVAQQHL